MKKILCLTDFSKPSSNAVTYAAKFAQATHWELVLIKVKSVFPRDTEHHKGLTLVEIINDELVLECKKISLSYKISCYPNTQLTDLPLASIFDKKVSAYELIIIGTNGVSDYYDFFEGVGALKFFEKSSAPVLMIQATCGYSPINKIVYCTESQKNESLPITELIKFAKPIKSKVYILYIVQQPFSRALETSITRNQNEIKELYSGEIQLHFDTIWSKEIASSVYSYIQRIHSDALVLYSMRKDFLKGLFLKDTVKIVSAITKYPVIVFSEDLNSLTVPMYSIDKKSNRRSLLKAKD